MRIAIIGTCQAQGLAACMRALAPGVAISSVHVGVDAFTPVYDADQVFLQTMFAGIASGDYPVLENLLARPELWGGRSPRLIPSFYFPALHPDLIYGTAGGNILKSPVGDYNSALVLYGWLNELTPAQTTRLFREAVFDHLGYFDGFDAATRDLIDDSHACGIDAEPLISAWRRCWFF